MADPHVALETLHVTSAEDITHQTIALAQQETTFVPGHHARGILPAVLQYGQRHTAPG